MTIFDWLKEKGITVHDHDLIEQAFMHSSYANEHCRHHDNERLEFMGDAVLQVYSSDHLFRLDPPLNEGKMTTTRSQLVCEKALALYAKELGLNQFLLLGSGEEKSGGRNRDSICADMFEAFLGALYIDQGMAPIDTILQCCLVPRLKESKIEINVDYKTKLQEAVQADSRKTVEYVLVASNGPANNPSFTVQVRLSEIILGEGTGNSKKKAEQLAAKNALEKMAL